MLWALALFYFFDYRFIYSIDNYMENCLVSVSKFYICWDKQVLKLSEIGFSLLSVWMSDLFIFENFLFLFCLPVI